MTHGITRLCIVLAALGLGELAGAVPRSHPPDPTKIPSTTGPESGMLLVARRELPDPNFHRAVVLIISHGSDGTLGLVINRPSHARLADALPDLPGAQRSRHAIFFGGPVARAQMVMLVRNEKSQEGLTAVMENLYFGADRDLLELFLRNKKPVKDLRLYVGHAGWAPGQLHYELARGDWYLATTNVDAIFAENGEDIWERLIDKVAPIRIEVRRDELIAPPVRVSATSARE